MDNSLLFRAESRINAAYADLGHDQGWSFLYSPGSTLNPQARMLFMGLNPGGSGGRDQISLTTEAGNAYHPEVEKDWLGNGQPAPLQLQVLALYGMLKDKVGSDARTLMDSTLAANFCPFRSPSWGALKNQAATIQFSSDLWADILKDLQLTTIVCMSLLVFQQIGAIVVRTGGEETCSVSKEIGWGKVQYRYKMYNFNGREMLLLCLPHLSRYRVFTSPKCSVQVAEVVELISKSLADWTPACRG